MIEKTSREIEKEHDDRLIYAQHGHHNLEDTVVDLDDDDEEVKEMIDDEGVEITEVEDDTDLDLGEEL